MRLRSFVLCLLITITLGACGGGRQDANESASSFIQSARRYFLAAGVNSAPSAEELQTVRLYQAILGYAPSQSDLMQGADRVRTQGAATLSASLLGSPAVTALTDAAWARRLLDNLGINTETVTAPGSYTALASALEQLFQAYGPAGRAQITLNVTQLLGGLQTDATWGRAARAFDELASANLVYARSAAGASAVGVPTFFSASRFLEQASFGPTPESVAQVRSLGMSSWIDAQMALPATQIDWRAIDYPDVRLLNDTVEYHRFPIRRVMDAFVGGGDQLRLRVTWGLSSFMVVSGFRVPPVGVVEYFNHLQRGAFGSFEDLLRMLARNASMGLFLDNIENRTGCPECQINENFARELLQLFSIGPVMLKPDGSPLLDAAGVPIESFSQRDVRELARALTGWVPTTSHVRQTANYGSNNYGYDKPMTGLPVWHDNLPKSVLGVSLPGGQSPERDLESVVQIIAAHPNVGPFVVRRLIQALVTSDPSPQYIRRVVAVFQDDGNGRRGNLAAVVKAILMEDEARAGDAGIPSRAGRIKEPVLVATGLTRALGCQSALFRSVGQPIFGAGTQQPFNAPTVFGFTAPDYRVPGSALNAPEQKLMTAVEMATFRVGGSGIMGWYEVGARKAANFVDARCRLSDFAQALDLPGDEFLTLVANRLYRGSMDATTHAALRKAVAIAKRRGEEPDPTYKDRHLQALYVLAMASATAGFGVVR